MKKLISVLIALVMVFGIGAVAFAENQTTVPDGYIGIYTAEDLNNIRNNLSGKYILMNDIDLSVYENWEPIGDMDTPFTGELDGNGYIINSLKITTVSETTSGYVGLFGVTNEASLRDLTMIDGNISISKETSPNVYSVSVGMVTGLDIEPKVLLCNSISAGVINVAEFDEINIGGFAGKTKGFCGFVDCVNYSNIKVLASQNTSIINVAGISAEKEYRTVNSVSIIRCANYGDLLINNEMCEDSAETVVSGITNKHQAEDSIKNCYNRGIVSVSDSIGRIDTAGLVGKVCNEAKNCYNSGAIMMPSDANNGAYAVCGNIDGLPSLQFGGFGEVYVQNCYYINKDLSPYSYNSQSNADKYVENVKLLTEDEMKNQESFVGFDFENVWKMEENGYPVLKNQPTVTIKENIELVEGDVYGDKVIANEWVSTNPDVATVNENSEIIAVGVGEATITVKIAYGYTEEITVNVIGEVEEPEPDKSLFEKIVDFIKNLFERILTLFRYFFSFRPMGN